LSESFQWLTDACIITRDRVVNFEEAMLANTKGGAEGVGYISIGSANWVSAWREVSSSKQAKSRQEGTSVIAEAQSDLASVGSFSKGSDTSVADTRYALFKGYQLKPEEEIKRLFDPVE
jgi:hypothetical protein